MLQAINLFEDSTEVGSIAVGSIHSTHETVAPVLPEQEFLPDAYKLPEGSIRGPVSTVEPRVVFIEVTNRCNLLCETCPRTLLAIKQLQWQS